MNREFKRIYVSIYRIVSPPILPSTLRTPSPPSPILSPTHSCTLPNLFPSFPPPSSCTLLHPFPLFFFFFITLPNPNPHPFFSFYPPLAPRPPTSPSLAPHRHRWPQFSLLALSTAGMASPSRSTFPFFFFKFLSAF